MGDRALKKIAEYLKAHRWKKNWQAVLTSLAAVVVFCTTYALILPAITLEKANVGIATQSDADRKTGAGKATPGNAVKSTTVSGNDPEEDGDLIFDLDYDLGTRRSLTRGVRSLGIDVDMGVPEWMLSDWDDVPSFDGELTGNWAQDLLAVAESQVGYIADYEGKSYYGDWYGKPYDDWDAMFVSYCLDIAEVPEDVIPREASAAELAESLVNMDTARFVEAESHTPEAGELIFFDTDGDGEADRVGIVAQYNARTGELKVIEGDYRTEVERYETEEPASPSNAEKATPSDAKKVKPGRGGGIGSTATPSDAGKVSQKTSPLGSTIGKKETILLTEAVEKEDEDETEDADEIDSYDIISEAAIVSYDLEELLSGEENVSVVGYAETVMQLTPVSNQNIVDYADEASERELEVSVLDSDENPIEADGDGNYNLYTGEPYDIQLDFTSTIGMASGTYYYDFPDGLTLTDETGTLTIPDNSGDSITVGSWVLLSNGNGGGTIIFTVEKAIQDYTDIALTVSVTGAVAEGITEITIGENLYTIVDPKENKTLTLDKVFRSADVDGGKINWRINIVGGKDKGLAGAKIEDTISDTTNHWYTKDDINAMYLEVKDNDGNEHKLTLSTSDVTWDNDYWQYELPDEFTCDLHYGETVTLPASSESSAGWTIRLYYTSTIRDGLTGDTVLGNQVRAFDLTDYEEASINQSDIEGSIIKTGTWNGSSTDGNGNEDNINDAYISWSIEAVIPGVKEDEPYPYSWQINDTTKIDGTDDIEINNLELDSSDIEVTATFEDETTIPLKNVNDIEAGDTMAWDLLSTNSYSSDRTLRLWSRCSCTEDTCGNWSDSKDECATETDDGFCRCWCIDEDVTITITYKTGVVYQSSDSDKEQNLIDRYAGHFLRNRAVLQYQYLPEGSSSGYTTYSVGHDDAEVTIPGMLTKKLTDGVSSSNGQIAQYEVTLNEARVDLGDLSGIEIVDTMTYNLVLMPYSITITATDANGNAHEVTDYTVEYEPYDESASDPTTITSDGIEVGANVAAITINQSELGPYRYTITYNEAFYLPAGKDDTVYSNQAVVEVYGKKYSSELISEEVASVSVTGETYSITITKKDASSDTLLEGAVFGVFTKNGTQMAEATTDKNGQVTIETNKNEGILFHEHTVYYLQEIEAPYGYALNDSRYYFWFCDKADSSECSSCDEEREKLGEGVSVYVDEDAQSAPGKITITNEPGRKLPESGGTGTLPYTMTGILLTSCACLMYKETRRRRGREEV